MVVCNFGIIFLGWDESPSHVLCMFHFGCRGQGLEVGGNGPGFVGGRGGVAC